MGPGKVPLARVSFSESMIPPSVSTAATAAPAAPAALAADPPRRRRRKPRPRRREAEAEAEAEAVPQLSCPPAQRSSPDPARRQPPRRWDDRDEEDGHDEGDDGAGRVPPRRQGWCLSVPEHWKLQVHRGEQARFLTFCPHNICLADSFFSHFFCFFRRSLLCPRHPSVLLFEVEVVDPSPMLAPCVGGGNPASLGTT